MQEEKYIEFPKISRLKRPIVVTEKIDGTNALIQIGEDGSIRAGSRTRWITPNYDNFGFASWVYSNAEELKQLGVGRHHGEWWGSGIQRKYSQSKRHFTLFNAGKWRNFGSEPIDNKIELPSICSVVPILYQGEFCSIDIEDCILTLRENGSQLPEAKGFMNPEGIVIYHAASGVMFKQTLENDSEPKSKVK